MIYPNRIFAFALLLLAPRLIAQAYWQAAAPLPIAVAGGQAVVHDDKIYLLSGWSDSLAAPAAIVQIYDPQLDRWQVQRDAADARHAFYLFTLNNQACWAGGLTRNSQNNQELLQWDFIHPPQVAQTRAIFDRVHANAFAFGRQLFLVGGYAGSASATPAFITGFDLDSQQVIYQETTTFPGDLPYQQQAAEMEGQYYIFGGVYNGVLNRIFRFNPQTYNLARVFPNLMEPRAGGQAVTVADRGIYLLGGYNEAHATLASVEIFNVHTGAAYTMDGPSLTTPRREAMAAVGRDYLYVFGGKDHRGECLRSVERLYVGAATKVNQASQQPSTLQLGNNYPNPFNQHTRIPVRLQKSQSVRIEVVAADGRLVKVLHEGTLTAAEHLISWNGTDDRENRVAGGIYFCRLRSDDLCTVKKMLLLP